MTQSVAALNALMKYSQDGLVSLIPNSVKLYKMLTEKKLKDAEMTAGRKLLVAIEASAPGGATYGDGTAFAYNTVIDATYPEAQLDCYPVVLGASLSNSVIDRLAKNPIQGVSVTGMKSKSLFNELAKIAEISMFYGKSAKGVGTVGAVTGTSGTSLVVTFTAGQWAPGIWAGRKNIPFEVRTTAGAAHAGTTAAKLLTVQSVDFVNKKVTFLGDATEIGTVIATDVIYPFGAYTNDMVGLDAILNTDGTVFSIDNTSVELWRGTRYTLGSLAFSELVKAVGAAVTIGGLQDDTVCFINSDKYESLNSTVTNQNYRNQGSAKNDGVTVGTSGQLQFQTAAGTCTLLGSPIIKEADSFIFNPKDLDVYGVKLIDFGGSTNKEDYWEPLPNNYGARMQGAYEFAIMLQHPAQAVKVTVP